MDDIPASRADIARLNIELEELPGVRFWLWGYVEADGSSVYVLFSQGHGSSLLGLGSGDGLTPEQFIALQYARSWRPKIDGSREANRDDLDGE